MRSKDIGQTAIQGLMELMSGRVLGPVTKWPRVRIWDRQVKLKNIYLDMRVSLAISSSKWLPNQVVDTALVKADWIPLP